MDYMNEYYDEYGYDYNLYDMDDNINDKFDDEWFSDNGEEWIVSSLAISDKYDTKWNNDDVWDDINNGIITQTGNRLTRKCLHMWGQRLCLCQFLDWLDSHKYKCLQNRPVATTVAAAKIEDENYYEYDNENEDIDIELNHEITGHLEMNSFSTNEFDDTWDNDNDWDEIATMFSSDGRSIRRKCLHIWKGRLCLCQFLGWIDDKKKYHCIYHEIESQ
eukprot:907260_1